MCVPPAEIRTTFLRLIPADARTVTGAFRLEVWLSPQLSAPALSPALDGPVRDQGAGVAVSGGDLDDIRQGRGLPGGGDHVDRSVPVGCRVFPQPPAAALSPALGGPVRDQSAGVGPPGADLDDALEGVGAPVLGDHGDRGGASPAGGPVPKGPVGVGSAPPALDRPPGEQGAGVLLPGGHLDDAPEGVGAPALCDHGDRGVPVVSGRSVPHLAVLPVPPALGGPVHQDGAGVVDPECYLDHPLEGVGAPVCGDHRDRGRSFAWSSRSPTARLRLAPSTWRSRPPGRRRCGPTWWRPERHSPRARSARRRRPRRPGRSFAWSNRPPDARGRLVPSTWLRPPRARRRCDSFRGRPSPPIGP